MGVRSTVRSWLTPRETNDALLISLIEQRSLAAGVLTPWQVGKPTYPSRSIDTYTTEGFAKLALIFRCINIVSNAIGSAPVRVYEEAPDGKQTTLSNHPMRQLMRRPNYSTEESRFLTQVALLATVSGFCVVEKERSAAGRVVGLWPLRPDWCRPIPRNQAPPDWEYRIPGIQTPFIKDAADVLVYTYADRPDLSHYGIGPMEVLLREIGLLNKMTDFLKAFFDGGAMPVYGIVPELMAGDTMTKDEIQALKEQWMRRNAGLGNSVEPIVLSAIKDVKKLSFDFNELAYTDLRDISDDAICQAFGIPGGYIGTKRGQERNTFSNATELRKSFYEDTITPLWRRLDGVLSLGLLPEFEARENVSLEFDTSDIPALKEDRNERAKWVIPMLQSSAMTVHTAHAELGLPKPDGDDFYLRGIALEAIPADDPLGIKAAKENPPPAQLPPPITVVPQDPTDEDEARALRVINEWRGRRVALREGRSVGEIEKTASYRPRDVRAAIGTVNRRQISRIAEKATPWTAAYFREAGKRIAGSTRSSAVAHERSQSNGYLTMTHQSIGALKVESRAADSIDWKAEERELTKLLTRVYQLSGDTAYASANDQLGTSISFDLANPKLIDVRTLLAERVKGINDESRGVIQNIVTDALESGKTVDELATQLSSKFGEWSEGRALTVARSESQVSYGMASIKGYEEAGVTKSELFDNPEHDSDPGSDGWTCAQRNGQIVTLEKAQESVQAEHPNGTLSVAPVVDGED